MTEDIHTIIKQSYSRNASASFDSKMQNYTKVDKNSQILVDITHIDDHI